MFKFACSTCHAYGSDTEAMDCAACLRDMHAMRPVGFISWIDMRWRGQLGLPAALQMIGGKWPRSQSSYRIGFDFKIDRNGRLHVIDAREPDGEPPANWWFEYLGVQVDAHADGMSVPRGCLAVA
jgi:hypothetical protein